MWYFTCLSLRKVAEATRESRVEQVEGAPNRVGRLSFCCRVLKGVQGVEPRGGGGTLGNPQDSVWEDWGALGED